MTCRSPSQDDRTRVEGEEIRRMLSSGGYRKGQEVRKMKQTYCNFLGHAGVGTAGRKGEVLKELESRAQVSMKLFH